MCLYFMKKFIIILLFILSFCDSLFCQTKSTDTICNCSKVSNLKYPKEEDGITGTVIVEFDVDSMCHFSNPIIVQSLGKNFDAEAMRVVTEQIKFNNFCINACKIKSNCLLRKIRLPITFTSPQE
jgi:Gram-negative bacterial TonB protein C-terminal